MCVCLDMCVLGFYCARSVSRDFVGLLGNDGVIKVHFEEWWGERNAESQEEKKWRRLGSY